MSDVRIELQPTADEDALIILAGDLDLSSVDDLENVAVTALDTRPRCLVLDAAGVTFLNSTTLGAFVRIQRHAEARGSSFALRNPSPLVKRLLRLSGLEDQIYVEI